MRRNWLLYVFLLPAVIYMGIFLYAPMYGLVIAFKDFTASKGILGSPWVGTKWFELFFTSPRFWQILKNTLILSVYSLIVGFPLPVILALMINDIRNLRTVS